MTDTADSGTSTRPTVGWNVLHLFLTAAGREVHPDRALQLIGAAEKKEHQVVTASILGHKADLCVMAIGPDQEVLRELQSGLVSAGFGLASSYISLTEVSEYASGAPEEMKTARLYPVLPPAGLKAFCFYPMSKRRTPDAENWYTLSYEEREKLMYGHGAVGRTFRGRVLQLITGSTGLDDYEWAVTLFAKHPDDLKECVYKMRFDEASALYAEFGPFYTGYVADAEEALTGGRGAR